MDTPEPPNLKRIHAKRLREIYRSAGWPSQDIVEIELIAAGLLERVFTPGEPELVRVSDVGIAFLAKSAQSNRKAFSAHEGLVDLVAKNMLRDGRLVWKGLPLRAWIAPEGEDPGRWKMCMPDVFSIRNSSVQSYLEPIVHEIKVSRADLLGDVKRVDKRKAYLDLGGQCWYVLGCDAKGKPIGTAEDVPAECGVMICFNGSLEVVRTAPKRPAEQLPFGVWMALAKATPVRNESFELNDEQTSL